MAALLHDPPLIQHDDSVGMPHGLEPVSDDDDGSASNEPAALAGFFDSLP